MDTRQAYEIWATQYDTNDNKTRDLEAIALRTTLAKINFDSCLEIGCGTGKNTEWLITKATRITAVDFSENMLSKAKEKISSEKVTFLQADITEEWNFIKEPYQLISFSLVLEHIENIKSIFEKLLKAVARGGYVYVGELHPFKQYAGSKARFETGDGQQIVNCFDHNISDFTQAGKHYGFNIKDINEYFDDNNRNTIPRVLSILMRKN